MSMHPLQSLPLLASWPSAKSSNGLARAGGVGAALAESAATAAVSTARRANARAGTAAAAAAAAAAEAAAVSEVACMVIWVQSVGCRFTA